MQSAEPVVACARSWVGTRFHHQGRLKKTPNHKGGVDCLGLLVGVARELQLQLPDGSLLYHKDRTDYSHYPDTEALQQQLEQLLERVPTGGMQPGDIVLMRIDGSPQHLGIISHMDGGPGLIHAYAPARAVVEHVLNDWWEERIIRAYRIP